MSKTYRAPKGIKVKPSEIGYYNYWYPHVEEESVSRESFVFEGLFWRGSSEWKAVRVSKELAKDYNSPICVIWIEADMYKRIITAPKTREDLKQRANNDGK